MTEPAHGSRAHYLAGCREPGCVEANNHYYRAWRISNEPLPSGDRRHGTINGYVNYKCRCRRCTDANTAKSRLHRERLRGLA